MATIFKILIIIWTCICAILFFIVSILFVEQIEPGEATAADSVVLLLNSGLWFAIWFFPTLILGILAITFRSNKKYIGIKTCPFCRSDIHKKATVCPNCQKDIPISKQSAQIRFKTK